MRTAGLIRVKDGVNQEEGKLALLMLLVEANPGKTGESLQAGKIGNLRILKEQNENMIQWKCFGRDTH